MNQLAIPCCLHLGPRGERCSRPAPTGGFCQYHGRDTDSADWASFVRRVATVVLLLAFLWVTFADFLHELARLFR